MAFFEYLLQEFDDFYNARLKPIACKSSGSFVPNPINYSNSNNRNKAVSPNIDSSGSIQARSQILTDEKTYRTDFIGQPSLTGTFSFTNNSKLVTGIGTKFLTELNTDHYIKLSTNSGDYYSLIDYIVDDTNLYLKNNYTYTGTGSADKTNYLSIVQNGSIAITNSICEISSSTVNNSLNGIIVECDSAPLILSSYFYISQRIANQETYIGFVDDLNMNISAVAVFDGMYSNIIKFRTSSNTGSYNIQETSITTSFDTSSYMNIKIIVNQNCCSLYINDMCLATHDKHIPDSFIKLSAICGIKNKSTVTNTILYLDTLYVNSSNKIEITNNFNDKPLSVVNYENVNVLSGKLVTTATTANQIVLSYTVPANKSFYIKGFTIMVSGSVVIGDPVKIGKNALTEENAPGTVNNEIFRVFYLPSKTNYCEKFDTPILIAYGGDVIKVAVTPSAGTTTTWRASVDFILR